VIVQVAGSLQVGGMVAQVGQRLLGATAKMMMDRFFGCMQLRLIG
jgi:carbon monoxide dehydrogenase subunit G